MTVPTCEEFMLPVLRAQSAIARATMEAEGR